ncbi:putative RNA methyltransferase pc1998 [Bienertia sinuspersici]
MAVSFLSPLHLSSTSLISHRRFTCNALSSQPPPPLTTSAPNSISLNPSLNPNNLESSTSIPSTPLSCALQCPHFQSCSGCTHEYDLHHPSVVDEAVEFFKRYGAPDFTFDSCRLYGWRCRAKLAVRGSSENPLIGLYEEGTHNVVDIPECKAHHPNINAAIELLRKGITKLEVEPYDEDMGTGELRYVQMAVTTHSTSLPFSERYRNGKVQVSLVWNSRSETSSIFEKLNSLANFLWTNGGPRCNIHLIHSVWANFQTSKNNIIFGNRWRHLVGERDFWERVGGIDIYLTPSSFGQANTRAFDSLLYKLHKYVPYGSSVADLYGGAGTIGLSLAVSRKCRSVKCVEINKESKLCFEMTASRLPNSVDSNMSWHHADAAQEPLSWLLGSDVIVVDPPRKGLDDSLLSALQTISSVKRKAVASARYSLSLIVFCILLMNPMHNTYSKGFSQTFSSPSNMKDEKRPWILREKESSVNIQSTTNKSESDVLPQTLIYISCGWDNFKKVLKMFILSNTIALALDYAVIWKKTSKSVSNAIVNV